MHLCIYFDHIYIDHISISQYVNITIFQIFHIVNIHDCLYFRHPYLPDPVFSVRSVEFLFGKETAGDATFVIFGKPRFLFASPVFRAHAVARARFTCDGPGRGTFLQCGAVPSPPSGNFPSAYQFHRLGLEVAGLPPGHVANPAHRPTAYTL